VIVRYNINGTKDKGYFLKKRRKDLMKFTDSAFTSMVIVTTLMTASLPLSLSAAMADSPAINITEYELNTNTVEECINTAETVMKQEGFQNLNIGTRDVFGVANNISVEMYCVRDGKTMVLVLSGSNPDKLQKLQAKLDKRLLP
jgi:hypothetical protein